LPGAVDVGGQQSVADVLSGIRLESSRKLSARAFGSPAIIRERSSPYTPMP